MDQGKVVIRVKTMSMAKADGEVILRTKVKVHSVERGQGTAMASAIRF